MMVTLMTDMGMKEYVYVQVKMAMKMAGEVWWITDVTNMTYVIYVHKTMFVSPWRL